MFSPSLWLDLYTIIFVGVKDTGEEAKRREENGNGRNNKINFLFLAVWLNAMKGMDWDKINSLQCLTLFSLLLPLMNRLNFLSTEICKSLWFSSNEKWKWF